MSGLTLQTLLCIVVALCAGHVEGGVLRHIGQAESFVRALDFKYHLRVCNAYPYGASIDVYRGRNERLTGDSPMPYKECRDFNSPLKSGDKLEFRVGDATAGTFAVSELPNNDAVLLLVIHRHDTVSTAVSFESHVFSTLDNAQVAILDTYKGKEKSMPRIVDAPKQGDENQNKTARSEELRFDSVVAVNPGAYEVELVDQDGLMKAKSSLVTLSKESYVVIRTGVEASEGPSFPQDLIVYPQSDISLLRSGAASMGSSLAFLLLVFATR